MAQWGMGPSQPIRVLHDILVVLVGVLKRFVGAEVNIWPGGECVWGGGEEQAARPRWGGGNVAVGMRRC